MKHYIDQATKAVYAYEADGSQDKFIKTGLVPISDLDLAILRAPTLSQAGDVKINELTLAFQAAIQQDVSYLGTTFQADSPSQQLLTAAIAPGALPPGFAWLDADNTPVPMTIDQLKGLAGAMLAQGFAAFVKLQEHKAAVRAAKKVDEVGAVKWV